MQRFASILAILIHVNQNENFLTIFVGENGRYVIKYITPITSDDKIYATIYPHRIYSGPGKQRDLF